MMVASAAPLAGAMDGARITPCSTSWSISHCNRGDSARDREVYESTRWLVCASGAGHRLLDRRQRRVRLGAIRPAGLRHVGPAAAALAAERFGTLAHQFDRVEARREIGGDADDEAGLAVLGDADERDDAGADLLLAVVDQALQVLGLDALDRAGQKLDAARFAHAAGRSPAIGRAAADRKSVV